MSDRPKPPRNDGMSRRDFVHGRFWRALKATPDSKTDDEPTDVKPVRVPLVMRYPKALSDVEAADEPMQPGKPTFEANHAARRRIIPVHRPPGAVEESQFLESCTRCGDCIKACPHDAITLAPEQMREASGTPMISADHQACMMCDDFPCITACDEEALSRQVPIMMGTARVTEHLCLAHHGTTCTVCSERCPVDGAIQVRDGMPTVSETSCTGCGVCRFVCPAPENAILLMPSFARPPAARSRLSE